jgi:RNA polymerase sigma factor (sigma-70 family)
MSTDSFRIEDLKMHARWLRRLAQALAADGSGDDLVQDTMLAAWQRAPERRASLRPWLRRVLTNLGRMRRRSDRQLALRQQAWAETSAQSALSPDELFERHESIRRLASAVSALDEPYRSTVLLRYTEEKSTAEIAHLHGVPSGTVRWRLSEALVRLRRALDDAHRGNRQTWAALFLRLAPKPRVSRWMISGALGLTLAGATGVALYLASSGAPSRSTAVAAPDNEERGRTGSVVNQPGRPVRLAARFPAIVTDTGAPDYDPLELMAFAQPDRIFEAEPRECSWAAAMEVRLERNILAELRVRVPEATIESLVCRRSSCALMVVLPQHVAPTRVGAAMIALQRPAIASGISFPAADPARPWRLLAYLLFSRQEREPQAYDRWYASERETMAKALSGPNTPPANRPANPPAPVVTRDAGPLERSCRRDNVAPLAPPVEVPDAPSPLEQLLIDRDPGAFAIRSAFRTIIQTRVRTCRQQTGARSADYTRLVARGQVDAVPETLRISNVHLEVADGAPLDPSLASCLDRDLAGTLTTPTTRVSFATVTDSVEAEIVLGRPAADLRTPAPRPRW